MQRYNFWNEDTSIVAVKGELSLKSAINANTAAAEKRCRHSTMLWNDGNKKYI